MTTEEIIRKIAEVIEDVTDIPASDIQGSSVLMDDLELSSLEVMTIIADLEKVFHIRLKEKELMNIITVSDVAECIQNKLA